MNKKALLKAALPIMVAGAMLGTNQYNEHEIKDNGKKPLKLTRGYEHKGKSPERLEKRRANRKRLKAKKNAKKGVYKNKIKYPRKRS